MASVSLNENANANANADWRHDADVVELRRTVLKLLLDDFTHRKPEVCMEWRRKLHEFTRRLEEEIFRLAKSKTEYADKSTLFTRTKQAARSLCARIDAAKAALAATTETQSRVSCNSTVQGT